MKIRDYMNMGTVKKIKNHLTLESAKKLAVNTGHFIMENKMFCLQLAIMAGTVLMVQDSSFAMSVTENTNSASDITGANGAKLSGKINAIEGPLKNMQAVMSGTVPRAICTIGAAVGAASWAMNIENQVTKTAMRVVGGSSVALGATSFIGDTTGFVLF